MFFKQLPNPPFQIKESVRENEDSKTEVILLLNSIKKVNRKKGMEQRVKCFKNKKF